MKLVEKILVGTDFSPAAESALAQAIQIAKKFDSSIILTHIIPDFDRSSLSEDMIRVAVGREMTILAEKLINEGIAVETIVEKGIPFVQIMEIAELKDVNVIVVGAGDETNLSSGMTAEKLMSKSIKPVWVVPIDNNEGISSILCPVDFSETSDRALENAIHLSRQFDAELTVLHVIEKTSSIYSRMKLSKNQNLDSDNQKSAEQFNNYLEGFDFFKVRWNKILLEGVAAEEIIKQAKNMSLLLIGSVGRTAHPKLLTGRTARIVLRTMPTAIITFKSKNVIELKLADELKDIQARFKQGIELMDNGFVREAMAHFKYCLHEDPLYAPAWEVLADAHYRLGEEEKALEFKSKAAEIREKLWAKRVEAEIKNRHALYKNHA